MDKRLAIHLSMRISFVEKTLSFLRLPDDLKKFRDEVKDAVENRYTGFLESLISDWEQKLFDNSKMLELPNIEEAIHPLLKGAVK